MSYLSYEAVPIETTVATRVEVAYSVTLIPASVVAAVVIGWLAVRVSPFFLLLLFVPMILITLSCLGLRGLRHVIRKD